MATLDSRIRVSEDVLFTDVGGEAVLLNLETGRYYGLDEVGTRMWTLLMECGEIEPAYRVLLSEYEVSEEELQRDLASLVEELAGHGLLQVEGGKKNAT